MLPAIEQLLVLQDRDRKIRTLKQELKVAPLQRKDFDDKLTAANAKLEAAKLKSKELEVDRKNLEIEAQTKRTAIAKFQVQKFQTRKNEEFQALNNEIARHEEDVRKIEDRELELMESLETAKVAIADADKQAKTAKTQTEQQLADLATKVAAMESQLHEVEAERAKLAEPVEEELLDTFNHLFANRGEAVVALDHEVCTGCHMKITTQTAVRVRGGREIVQCEQCSRILYPAG